ncbi:hypothetical protein GTQ99_03470 [Kineococcus sp. T13]|uniref:hypothetical protein n=1 Tax=Kineococcus vitellinus TaxID=2696565 RepID=UPI001411D253|nr:hypothetical protein [Kineococcus vitellinus]NAZ74483.1 hypothetical protein [Kineococcus vitellinus]
MREDTAPGGAGARRPTFRHGLTAGLSVAGLVALCSAGAWVLVPRDAPAARTAAGVAPTPAATAGAATPAPTVVAGPAADAGEEAAGEGAADEEAAGEGAAGEDDVEAATGAAAAGAASPTAEGLPVPELVTCPAPTARVTSAAELSEALQDARPGDVVHLADGTYEGNFAATASGTADDPVWLCGGRGAVLDAGGPKEGYGFHLDGASHWRLVGFTVRNAQKGVVADGSTGSVLQDLLVERIGDEAIHLRSHSTRNSVLRNTVRDTGLRREKFGEGVYVGSAQSNWEKYGAGGPDRSDGNVVAWNDIARTTSESVDVKEGTTGGLLLENVFDGTGMVESDSWVDVKGNGWTVRGNTGRNTPDQGFQTHRILDGWGAGNTFDDNVLDVPDGAVAIYVHDPDVTGNVITCSNRDSGGHPVTSTVPCSGGSSRP